MEFEFGVTVLRDRRPTVFDEPSGGMAPGAWADAVTVSLEGAFVASSSSSSLRDATRSQILTAKSLYLTDPDQDVLPGDRIRDGAIEYFVNVKPAGDVNPFTGDQLSLEIPLENTEG